MIDQSSAMIIDQSIHMYQLNYPSLVTVALGDRFGLFIQTLNNAEKLFIQIIHSIEKRIIAHLVMGDRFGLFIQTLNNA